VVTPETRKRHVREELGAVTRWVTHVLRGNRADDEISNTLHAIERLATAVREMGNPITNSDQGETPPHPEELSSQKTEDPD
jgi:hypothetical protein